jgi:hypothetical protein
MRSTAIATRAQARLVCAFAALTLIACAGLFTAAALVPAPPAVLPFLVAVCIAGPMIAALELRAAIHFLRRNRRDSGSLDSSSLVALRRHLAQLPETRHPLGL